MSKKRITFEKALERLEKLTVELERGDLSLEESLERFKEGIELTRYCRKLLSEAEYRLEMVLQDGQVTEFNIDE